MGYLQNTADEVRGNKPNNHPSVKDTPGHTSPKGISREISGVAPPPVEIWRGSLRNRRKIPGDIDLKLKFEAISKKTSQGTPGSVLTSTVLAKNHRSEGPVMETKEVLKSRPSYFS